MGPSRCRLPRSTGRLRHKRLRRCRPTGPILARSRILPFRPPPELSEREREILVLIARGRKHQEIARTLVLSPKTVRNYVSNILSKLQVADRPEAIVRARDAGL